jgi:hypothetical protein
MEGEATTFFISEKVSFQIAHNTHYAFSENMLSDSPQYPLCFLRKCASPGLLRTYKTLYQNLVLTKASRAYKVVLNKMGEATKKQGE